MIYDASSIQILKGLEAVRRRPSLFVGSTGPAGAMQLVFEVVQNSVDEAMAGHCRLVRVAQDDDGAWEVEDDGRGIPVDPHPSNGRPACEIVLTTLHAGGKFGRSAYAAPGGQHGVGLACVNALSEWLVLEVWRDGGHHRQPFARGEVVAPLERVGTTERRGCRVRFRPDPAVFGELTRTDQEPLLDYLESQAFLNPGLRIEYEHRATDRRASWCYTSGAAGLVSSLNRSRPLVHSEPIHVRGRSEGVEVEAALQWTRAGSEDVRAYANSVFTPQGGTHVQGLRSAIARAMTRAAAARGLAEGEGDVIAGSDAREGLTCVLSVHLSEPEFEGQVKSRLTSAGATAAVEHVVSQGLDAWLGANPADAAAIVGRALEASRARAAARRAGDHARYLSEDLRPDVQTYREQFGHRSSNWHESARWITDGELLRAHAAACRAPRGALVLDVCCGSGVVGAAFRPRGVGRIVGLDLTPQMARRARERLDDVLLGDVYRMPFPDARFDVVVTREVLHILPRPELPLGEIFRVLKPGGQFITGQWVPYGATDGPWMFRIVKHKQPLFCNNLTEADLAALLQGAGFAEVQATECLQWEDIDTWISSWETPALQRAQIRDLYADAPAAVRAVHPFRMSSTGRIEDCWRWCVFSALRPAS